MAGRTQDRISPSKPLGGAPLTFTPAASSLSAIAGSTRTVANCVLPSGSGDFSVPWIEFAETTTSETCLAETSCSNWLYGIVSVCASVVQNCCRAATARKAITTYHIVQVCLRSFGSMAQLLFSTGLPFEVGVMPRRRRRAEGRRRPTFSAILAAPARIHDAPARAYALWRIALNCCGDMFVHRATVSPEIRRLNPRPRFASSTVMLRYP